MKKELKEWGKAALSVSLWVLLIMAVMIGGFELMNHLERQDRALQEEILNCDGSCPWGKEQ